MPPDPLVGRGLAAPSKSPTSVQPPLSENPGSAPDYGNLDEFW